MRAIGLLLLWGAAGVGLGLLRLAAEMAAPKKPPAICPVCGRLATDDPYGSGVYCDRHEGWYRWAGQERREA